MKILQKKNGFQRHSKKGLPLLGEVSAHAVLKHQHHQDPLLQQAKNTKIANLQQLQKMLICKKCKFALIAKITKMATKYNNHKKRKVQRFSIVSSSRRHQTLSHSGSNRETGSQSLTKSPSPPAAHLLTPPPVSPIVRATNLWISQSLLRVNRFLVVSLDLRMNWFCVNSVC